jgi:hypothetical protein
VRVESKVSAQMNSLALILPFILEHRDRGSLGRLWEGHGKGGDQGYFFVIPTVLFKESSCQLWASFILLKSMNRQSPCFPPLPSGSNHWYCLKQTNV